MINSKKEKKDLFSKLTPIIEFIQKTKKKQDTPTG